MAKAYHMKLFGSECDLINICQNKNQWMETANWLHTLVVNGALEMEGCPTDVICEFSISGWLELMAGAAIHSVMIRPLSTHIRTYQTGHLSFFL